MRRKYLILLGLLVAAGAVMGVGAVATQTVAEHEIEVSIDAVPPAVKATILAQAQGNAITEIETDTENGQTVYEAEVVINSKEVDIRVAANGALLNQDADDEDGADDTDEADDDEDAAGFGQRPRWPMASLRLWRPTQTVI